MYACVYLKVLLVFVFIPRACGQAVHPKHWHVREALWIPKQANVLSSGKLSNGKWMGLQK